MRVFKDHLRITEDFSVTIYPVHENRVYSHRIPDDEIPTGLNVHVGSSHIGTLIQIPFPPDGKFHLEEVFNIVYLHVLTRWRSFP
jgi:hypothetical protein